MTQPSDLVTALPLPPNYFMSLDVEDIKKMVPPPTIACPDLSTFGVSIRVKDMGRTS